MYRFVSGTLYNLFKLKKYAKTFFFCSKLHIGDSVNQIKISFTTLVAKWAKFETIKASFSLIH